QLVIAEQHALGSTGGPTRVEERTVGPLVVLVRGGTLVQSPTANELLQVLVARMTVAVRDPRRTCRRRLQGLQQRTLVLRAVDDHGRRTAVDLALHLGWRQARVDPGEDEAGLQ